MEWLKVNKYCIESGPYRVTKFYVNDKAIFLVFHVKQIIGRFEDPLIAKEHAKKHKAETTGETYTPPPKGPTREQQIELAKSELAKARAKLHG